MSSTATTTPCSGCGAPAAACWSGRTRATSTSRAREAGLAAGFLTDHQLRAIAATGGVVGICFSVAMLRPDGRFDTWAPIADVVRHVDHVADKVGIDHVALGSDFDGAVIPDEIGDVTGLPRVFEALRAAGYDDESL